jgi:peroxiredoxin
MVGDTAVPFELPSASGESYSTDSIIGDKNIVLVFYRAFWWPYCRRQLGELTEELSALEGLDAQVLAISTDDLSGAQRVVSLIGIPFPILYNKDADVVKAYGVYDLLGDGLATPSTFIIDKQGVIRWKRVGSSVGDRPPASKVLEELGKL